MSERITHRVPELYFSIADLCALLRFSDSTIRKRVKGGDFSPPGQDGETDLGNILDVDGDLRIPASGVNFFLENHRLIYNPGVKARNLGELRRKLMKQGESAAA